MKRMIDTTYTLTSDQDIVIRDVDKANIPNHPDNIDYQMYQEWIAAGNTPNPVPPLDTGQEAIAQLAGGLSITFTSDTTNSGTYSTNEQHRVNLNGISSYLNLNGNFPGNSSTVIIYDINNNRHSFTNKTYPKLATAIGDFIHNCNMYALGEIATLPPNNVTIS
jgi:hypothetical protein